MKTISAIFIFLLAFAGMAFSQDKQVEAVLSSPQQRSEVYQAILTNHDLMMEFLTALKENDHATMMMQSATTGKMEMHSDKGEMHQGHEMMGANKDECMMKDRKSGTMSEQSMSCCSDGEKKEAPANPRPMHKHK